MLISLPRRGTKRGEQRSGPRRWSSRSGCAPPGAACRGRLFRPGSDEIVIGSALAGRFEDVEIGSSIRFANREWKIVGRFDAGGSGFDSEIWGDSEQLMQSFRRDFFSVVTVRLVDRSSFDLLKARLEADPRLTIEAKRERTFYEEQSRLLSGFIQLLGITLSVMFSLGAIIGATITMYAAVASRMMEIGVLRALGFRRSRILAAFLVEALMLSLVGWGVGAFVRITHDAGEDFDAQLDVASRTRISARADARDRAAVARLRARDGLPRRFPAGRPGRPHEDRRRAARRLTVRLSSETSSTDRLRTGPYPRAHRARRAANSAWVVTRSGT